MKFTLGGVTAMTKKMQDIVKKLPDKVGAALYEEAQVEMTEAKKRCPVDTGVLRASGHVAEPERKGRRIAVTLSFGGAASAYAIAVHEHLSPASPPSWVIAEEEGRPVEFHPAGTGPKFLESTLNESRPHMLERLGARLAFSNEKFEV